MFPSALSHLRDDFKVTTWLYTGAFLQAVIFLIYPSRLVALPAILSIAYSLFRNLLLRFEIIRDPSYDRVNLGKFTAQLVESNGSLPSSSDDKGLVVFILGARSNHAADGRFAPGFSEVGEHFGDMWRHLSANREKYGYLGKTSTLIATEDENSNVTCWISYWKSLEQLQAFAHSDSHRKGWDWYLRGKGYPHIGIMHETYVLPKGNWETIYLNFTPFGLGQTKQPIENSTASGLMEAKGLTWQSMKSRMKNLAAKGP